MKLLKSLLKNITAYFNLEMITNIVDALSIRKNVPCHVLFKEKAVV